MAVRVHLKAPEVDYTTEHGGYPKETVVTVDAGTQYSTQATNGAGLVCDVYEGESGNPVATFANVIYAEVVTPEPDEGRRQEARDLWTWITAAWTARNGDMPMPSGRSAHDVPLGRALWRVFQDSDAEDGGYFTGNRNLGSGAAGTVPWVPWEKTGKKR